MSSKSAAASVRTKNQQDSRRSKRIVAVIVGIAVVIAAVVGIVWAVSGSNSSSASESGIPEAQLPATTTVGVVELTVADLDTMRNYYEHAVGLEVLSESEGQVILGTDTPVLQLTAGEGEPFATPTEAGLYHSAILYADEASLAATIYQIATVAPQTYQGSADHAVSLAFYFVDPEGNGLELYVDTPEDTWQWVNGEVQMGSAALDPNAFIQQHLTEADAAAITDAPLAPDAIMGHVHLKVGDLAEAESFYADTLGFAVTARSDGALFYAAGGYHHHIATNVWQSQSTGQRANDTGLGSLSVVVENDAVVQQVAERLDASGHDYELVEGGLTTVDPWGNTVHLALV